MFHETKYICVWKICSIDRVYLRHNYIYKNCLNYTTLIELYILINLLCSTIISGTVWPIIRVWVNSNQNPNITCITCLLVWRSKDAKYRKSVSLPQKSNITYHTFNLTEISLDLTITLIQDDMHVLLEIKFSVFFLIFEWRYVTMHKIWRIKMV